MQSMWVPFPCVVYCRTGSGGHYTFSHCCQQQAQKYIPKTLRVSDIRQYDPAENWKHLSKACFLVLVAGDVAQCINLANAGDKKRIQFLYPGSAYARPVPGMPVQHTELSDAYVPLHFHGTMAVFDRFAGIRTAIPIESGIALFPRRILDADIPLLTRWVSQCAQRSLHASVWVTDSGHSYSEQILKLRQTHNKTRPTLF